MKATAAALLGHTPLWQSSRTVYHWMKHAPHRLRFASYRRSVAESVFIAGCGHTGTSLLVRILGEHPVIFTPTVETGAFIGHVHWQVLASLYADAKKCGRQVLVEKTPSHIHSVALIRATIPNAKFIVTARDGRDVVASLARRHDGDFHLAVDRWFADTTATVTQIGRSNVYLWRYEDFIDSPATSIMATCRFIGVKYDAKMLDYHNSRKSYFGQSGDRRGSGRDGAEHNALRAWQINQPITDSRGKWRQTLPPDVVAMFSREPYRALMLRLGYDPDFR